ncbi:MAG: CBS domain-containing protein [Bacteriovorax sp.]|nr:CBS domain-containing protein [Bacteriovorax sp.]
MNQVKDFMTVDPVCCLPTTNLKVVAKLMLQYDCGEIPVVYSIEQPKIVGVITDRDIVCRTIAHGLNPLEMTAEEAMTIPAVVVKTDMSIDDCCTIMKEEQIRRVPVVDEEENCCGMVTLADIARKSEVFVTAAMIKDISQPSYHNSPIEVS